ncbi:MAG: ABC transporter ATP-binding protein, partial [Planctomycetota bacterium]|nr:ABC transporter ATP-binding protein [Planctomycetota bacterium]
SLELAPGEQMLLTGGSGTGKSTLLQLIAGLIDPDQGSVLIKGHEIHALRGARRDLFRGESVGMIFQTFNLLHGFSALENVEIAMMFSRLPRREHRERAESLLRGLGIDRPDARPEAMSVGQQQRVAVARAVACQPALVLADEPTASLDPENADAAMDLIQTACRDVGAALLCVSHDPSMTTRFQRRAAFNELTAAR